MAQTIQIKRGTGSAIPSGLSDGELAINLDTGQLYYGSGSTSVNSFEFTDLTAKNYSVTSSVTHYSFQTLSGSSDFGDDVGDIHNRTGSLNVSGALNVVGNIGATGIITGKLGTSDTNVDAAHYAVIQTAANTVPFISNAFSINPSTNTTTYGGNTVIGSNTVSATNITASNNISASGTIVGSNLSGTNTGDQDLSSYSTITQLNASSSTLQTNIDAKAPIANPSFTGHITASGNISSSGDIYSSRYFANEQLALNNVNGAITLGYDNTYPINIGKSTNPIGIYGNITSSGNISASGDIEVNQILFDNGNHIVGHHVNDGLQIRTQNAEPIVFKTNGNNIRASIASDGVVNIVGNLDLDGNVIGDGATDISGIDQITTSTLRLTSTTDAGVSSTGHAFQAGATNSTNVIIDNNEIMARNNGAVADLHVNPDGGIITFNNSVSGDQVIIGNGHITASGNISGSSTSTILTGGTISSRDNIFLGEGSFANHILHFGPSAGNKTYPVINANADYELQIQRGSLETPLMKFFMRQHSAEPDTVHISGSLKVKTGPTTGTGHLEVEGNVTASGGISASSTIYAPRIDFNPASSFDYIDRSDLTGVLIKTSDNKITLLGNVTASGNISSTTGIIKAGWHNSPTRIKILVSDFIPDDIGRPAMIDDTGSDRWLESHGTGILFASIPIPTGFKATHVHIYGSATSALEVSEMNINSKTVTSKGTGNIGTELNITDVTSTATNYLLLELAQASGEEVYGGYVTIAAV